MNKSLLLCTIIAIIAFGAGWFTCLKVNTFSVEQKDFYYELIDVQGTALEQAEKVMWNNDLFDKDGSDDMAVYLDLCFEVDSLYNTTL